MLRLSSEKTFLAVNNHGSLRLPPERAGCVVLSQLDRGGGSIVAVAPSVKFVLQGEEIYEVDGRARKLAAGQFMLVEAGADVRVRTSRTEHTIGMCVYLAAPQKVPAPGSFEGAFGPAVLTGSAVDPLADLMAGYAKLLLRNASAGPALAPKIISDVARGAETYCLSFEQQLGRIGSAKQTTRLNTLKRLEAARSFIHANADRPLALTEIAQHAALSRFHLARTFADAYGLPPLAYHRNLRLEDAAKRLREHPCSPTDLSEELGYASLSAFSRAFRQRFGVPPSSVTYEG
jgi:AraC-like DNA-binding protein